MAISEPIINLFLIKVLLISFLLKLKITIEIFSKVFFFYPINLNLFLISRFFQSMIHSFNCSFSRPETSLLFKILKNFLFQLFIVFINNLRYSISICVFFNIVIFL